jgi:hypothetical protein
MRPKQRQSSTNLCPSNPQAIIFPNRAGALPGTNDATAPTTWLFSTRILLPPPKKRHRRMAKRRKTRELQGEKKLAKYISKSQHNKLKNMHTYIKKECIQHYGFISNIRQAPWQNKINALKTINPGMLDLRQPSNLAFHNLSDSELPKGTQRLLGLSLNFFFSSKEDQPLLLKTQ